MDWRPPLAIDEVERRDPDWIVTAERRPAGRARTPLAWGLATSIGLHLVVGAGLFFGFSKQAQTPTPPSAMAIELMPEPTAPAAPVSDLPPGPKQVEASTKPARAEPTPKLPMTPVVPTAKAVVTLPPAERLPSPPTKAAIPTKDASTDPSRERALVAADRTSAPASASLALPADKVAAAPAVGTPTASTVKAEQTWNGKVLARIEHNKRYPDEAKRAAQEDSVFVKITLDRSGRLVQSSILRSKGLPTLDSATLDAVKRSNPFPPLPASISGETYTFVTRLAFELRAKH